VENSSSFLVKYIWKIELKEKTNLDHLDARKE
jgi:hypothetical protein